MADENYIAYQMLFGDPPSGAPDWQPPADWLEVPEPGAWEANFLIEIRGKPSFALSFCNPATGYNGYGNITIDWGDGNTETFEGRGIDENGWATGYSRPEYNSHTYSEPGQYVVKVLTDKLSCYLRAIRDAQSDYAGCANLLIAKTGRNIRLDQENGHDNGGPFSYNARLYWAKINGNPKLQGYGFARCASLRRIDFAEPLTEIPDCCFENAPVPQNIDFSKVRKVCQDAFNCAHIESLLNFPECTEIGVRAFHRCQIKTPDQEFYAPKCLKIDNYAIDYVYQLKSFYAPSCESVGNYAFSFCLALETAEFAENCTFGYSCFSDCHSLYPRPDGSTN